MKVSYKAAGNYWHGAVKFNGKVVWTCPHAHHNRDQGSGHWGMAARDCASGLISVVECPAWSDAVRQTGARPEVINALGDWEAAAPALRRLIVQHDPTWQPFYPEAEPAA